MAEYAKENLFPMILSNIKENEVEFEQVLTKQFLDVDDKIMREVKQKMDISGIFSRLFQPN